MRDNDKENNKKKMKHTILVSRSIENCSIERTQRNKEDLITRQKKEKNEVI